MSPLWHRSLPPPPVSSPAPPPFSSLAPSISHLPSFPPSPAPSTLQHRPSLSTPWLPSPSHSSAPALFDLRRPSHHSTKQGRTEGLRSILFGRTKALCSILFDRTEGLCSVWPIGLNIMAFVWPNRIEHNGLCSARQDRKGPLFGPIWPNDAEGRTSTKEGVVGPMSRSAEETGPRGGIGEGRRWEQCQKEGGRGGDGPEGVERKKEGSLEFFFYKK